MLNKLKEEGIYLGAIFVLLIVALKIVFYKELFFNVLKMGFGIYLIFIIPGFCMMYFWYDELNFLTRFAVGAALGAAVIGILSYYLGIIGLNLKYHIFILPLAASAAGLFFNRKKLFKD